MHKLITLLMTGIVFVTCCPDAQTALFSTGSDYLLKIDEQEYTTSDFNNWWVRWREKDQPLPETLDPYVDWLLFLKEAEKMMLFDDPAYRRDINIFLRVVSQVQLKNDEIDGKTVITEEMMRKEYDELYVPVWTYHAIIVKDKDTAEMLYTDLSAGSISLDELIHFSMTNTAIARRHLTPEKAGSVYEATLKQYPGLDKQLMGIHQDVKQRKVGISEDWAVTLQTLDVGTFSSPLPRNENYAIIKIIEKFDGDQEDYEKAKKSITYKLRKEIQGQLTYELIQNLKKKYKVVINEERLAAIDPDNPAAEYEDTPLVTIGDRIITEREVLERLERELQRNKQYYGLERGDAKAQLVNYINVMTNELLITMESLDRHYEKQSPIKELMEFKKNNKLVVNLKKQISDHVSQIKDDEITEYYNTHKDELTGPDMYKMALIKGTEEKLNQLWLDVVVNGNEIIQAAKEKLGHPLSIKTYPAHHLDETVLAKLGSLNDGEISPVFSFEGEAAIVYLVDYMPAKMAPIEAVKSTIEEKLYKEKFEAEKERYIDDLRNKSTIEINEKVWAKYKAELNKVQ